VLGVSSLVLESVREIYERERQPAALREASEYLRLLTGGRYRRVWTPLGQRVLRVDDAQGQALPVEVLSRGTREQLFLALRLAIIRAYAEQGIRLPLVLDDVLVNFDLDRSKAAAAVLRDFARQGHQVFIFTCHEHIAELFKSLRAQVRQLPSSLVVKPDYVQPEPEPVEAERIPEPPPEPLPEPALPVRPAPLVLQAVALPPEEPPLQVLIERPVLRAEPVRQPDPPPRRRARPRVSRPVPPPHRRRQVDVHTVRWSAEEFEGELADRVANGVEWVEIPGPETTHERNGVAVARADDRALFNDRAPYDDNAVLQEFE
jgi:hypothetical protein